MSITPRRGKYVVDEYYHDHQNNRRRVRKSFDTKREAKQFEAELRRDKSTRKIRGIHWAVILMAELVVNFKLLPRYKKLKDSTKKRYNEIFDRFLQWCALKGIKYVHEFTRDHAQSYISYVMDVSIRKGRQHHFTAIKMLFAEELERDRPCIERNPFPRRCPFNIITYKPICIPQEVLVKLWEHMTDFEKAVYSILYFTAARTGELKYLTWNQVSDYTVTFEEHSLIGIDGSVQEWTTKTYESRIIPINDECKRYFEYLRKMRTESHNYVLPNVCRDHHWFTRGFSKIKRRTICTYPELTDYLFSADRTKQITPKTLRSTAITNIATMTGNVKLAQMFAGHRSIKTTIGHYIDGAAMDLQNAISNLKIGK